MHLWLAKGNPINTNPPPPSFQLKHLGLKHAGWNFLTTPGAGPLKNSLTSPPSPQQKNAAEDLAATERITTWPACIELGTHSANSQSMKPRKNAEPRSKQAASKHAPSGLSEEGICDFVPFCMRPGDLAIWLNGRVMHGREGYRPGGPRHIQGAYLDQDASLRPMPCSFFVSVLYCDWLLLLTVWSRQKPNLRLAWWT